MEFEIEKIEDVSIVKVFDAEIDASGAEAFKSEMTALIEAGNSRLVLDMSAVRFMDSSGLGAIVACLRALGATGKMSVLGLSESVSTLFKLTRLNRLIPIAETRQEAVDTVGAK